MIESTTNYLFQLLKKDKLFFQNDLKLEDLTLEIIKKLKKKIIKQYKIYRWTLAVTLSLIFATFLYLDIISPRITKSAQDIINYWVIWIPLISINLYISKGAWKGKRNILILEILETEVLNKETN